MTVQTIDPATARDLKGNDVLPELVAIDDRYLPMPNVGDTADLTFPAPPARAEQERAVFLHSRGYYKLHLSGTGDPDTKLLDAIENTPGAAARFAATQFGQWQIAKGENPDSRTPLPK
jgi:hypothetical protein